MTNWPQSDAKETLIKKLERAWTALNEEFIRNIDSNKKVFQPVVADSYPYDKREEDLFDEGYMTTSMGFGINSIQADID